MVLRALFMSSGLKRLNRLGEERMRAEVEHNAPRDSALGRPFHLGPSPAAAKREHEQERKDALRGADYRAWSSYGGMMVEAEFRGLADCKVAAD